MWTSNMSTLSVPRRNVGRRFSCRRLAAVVCALELVLAATGLPARADDPPDFSREVKPILKHHCAKCHTGTRKKGGFSINTREALLAGGESGTVVVPGKAGESYFIDMLTEEDPDLRMPQEAPPLTSDQIAVLRAWINTNVGWESGFAFGQEHPRAPLAPRQVSLPAGNAAANPIDRLLAPYFEQQAITPAEPVSDRVFARRVSLDLIGLLPTLEQLTELENDPAADKRARFIARLLDDRRGYADHWISLWNDLLRNAYRGTGFIDEGRSQITQWLYRSLYDNKPCDQFVHELISPVPGSDGFIKGIIWRGTVNDSQRREMQAAQNIAQVFLGTNLKCASCHDSFVNNWKVADAYALAAVFSDEALEIHRCNRPTGNMATMAFIYPELGEINALASRAERAQQLADLVVNPQNGRLARVIVNRLWAQLFGRGLVEPIDDMDAEPWNQDLLDWLSLDLATHQYDLKQTLALICNSRAYQLPATDAVAGDTIERYRFHGPLVKRLTAEQFADAHRHDHGLLAASDAGHAAERRPQTGGPIVGRGRPVGVRGQTIPPTTAKWIWSDADAMVAPAGQTSYFLKSITLDPGAVHVFGSFTADNELAVFVNGKQVGASDNWMVPLALDLTPALRPGENEVAVQAVNRGNAPNPAGFICDIAVYNDSQQLIARIPSDQTWSASDQIPGGWPAPTPGTRPTAPAVEFAAATAPPWAIADRLLPALPPACRCARHYSWMTRSIAHSGGQAVIRS